MACSSWAEAASQLQTHSDIQLIVLCREQRDQDSFDLVRQLEAAQPGRKIPIVIAYDEEGLLQVLTSASSHHTGLLHAIFNQSSWELPWVWPWSRGVWGQFVSHGQ